MAIDKAILDRRLADYNDNRPHESLGGLPRRYSCRSPQLTSSPKPGPPRTGIFQF